jgi:hypothetical protein
MTLDAEHFALTPLVLALSAALPLFSSAVAQAQTAARLPAVPTNTLPVPAKVGWLVNGKAGDSTWSQVKTATNGVGTRTFRAPFTSGRALTWV